MFITDFICPVLLVIACIAIVVITFLGFFTQNETIGIIGIIGSVCLILFVGISLGEKANTQPNEVVQEETKSIKTTETQQVQTIPEITYEPAELVNVTELENGIYEMLFVVGESEVQLFSWYDTYTYPDDVPYLLTMDNKGTLNDPTDDEIIVVWKDMN